MWLRDSSVQLAIYLPRIAQHPALRGVFEGMLRSQAFYILQVLPLLAVHPSHDSLHNAQRSNARGTALVATTAERV